MKGVDVNSNSFEPCRNFANRVRWNGSYVAGFSKVSALERPPEPVAGEKDGDAGRRELSPAARGRNQRAHPHGSRQHPEGWGGLTQGTGRLRSTR